MSNRISQHSAIPADAGVELPMGDWEKRVAELERQMLELSRGSGGSIDSPQLDCTPNYMGDPCTLCACAIVRQVGARNGKQKGIAPIIKYLIPAETSHLVTDIVRVDVWDSPDLTTQEKFDQFINSKTLDEDIDDASLEDGRLTAEWRGDLLEEETDYYIVQLKAKADGRVFAKTPPTAPVPGTDLAHPGQFLAKFRTKKIIPANPSLPSCSDILVNKAQLNDDDLGNAYLEFHVLGDADSVHTIEELDVDRVVLYFLPVPPRYPLDPDIPAGTRAIQREIEIGRDNLVDDDGSGGHFGLKIPVHLPLAEHLIWFKTKIVNAGGKAVTPVDYEDDADGGNPIIDPLQSCEFWAGGKVAASDADIPVPSIIDTDTLDSRNTIVTVRIPNTTPVLLKIAYIEISYDYDPLHPELATWKLVGQKKLRGEVNVNSAGTWDEEIPITHKKNIEQANWYLRVKLNGMGKILDGDMVTLRAPFQYSVVAVFVPYYGVPLGVPSYAIDADFASVINTDTETTDALVSCVIHCFEPHADGTPMDGRDGTHSPAMPKSFKAAHVGAAVAVIYADTGSTTEKHKIARDIVSSAERNATSITVSKVIPGLGDQLYWTKSKFTNGDGGTETVFTTPINISLGGVKKATSDGDVPVPSFASQSPKGNRHTEYDIQFTQSSPKATLLKKMAIQVSLDSGENWEEKPGQELHSENYYTPGDTYHIKTIISHPSGSDVLVRAKIVAAGRYKSDWVDSDGFVSAGDASTPAPSVNPSAPSTSAVIVNQVAKDLATGQARIVIRVSTADSGVFNARNITEAFIFLRFDTETADKIVYGGAISDLTQSFTDIEFFAPVGTKIFYTKAMFKNGNLTTSATNSGQFFIAGITIPTSSADVPSGRVFSLTPFGTSKRKDTIVVEAQQNTAISGRPMVGLAEIFLLQALNGGGYEEVWSKNLKNNSSLYAALGATKQWTIAVSRPPGTTVQYKTRQRAIGDVESADSAVVSDVVGSAAEGDSPIPLIVPTAPALGQVSTTLVNNNPEQGVAKVILTIALSSGTFLSNKITEVYAYIRLTADAGEGKRVYGGAVPDVTASSMTIEFNSKLGEQISWVKTKFVNGNQFQQTTATGVDFFPGVLRGAIPSDSVTLPTGVVGTVTARGTNSRKDTVNFTARQGTAAGGILWNLAFIVVEQNDGDGFEEVARIPLTNEPTMYNGFFVVSTTGYKDFTMNFKRRPGAAATYRVKQIAVGGKESAYSSTSGAGGTSPEEAPSDDTVPGAPIVTYKINYGVVTVSGELTSGNNTRVYYQFVLSTSSSFPSIPPAVGGVIKAVRNTAGVADFRIPRDSSGVTYYIYVRAGNTAVGSCDTADGTCWTRVTITPDDLDRPVDDFIGNAVIAMPTGTASGSWGDFQGSAGFSGADNGYTSVDPAMWTTPSAKTPMRVRHDSATNEDVIELWTPVGQNAYSLQYIQYEVYNGGGTLKLSGMVLPGFSTVFRIPTANVTGARVIRVRYNNMFRGTLGTPSDGWSDWSKYVRLSAYSSGSPCSGGQYCPAAYSPDTETPLMGDVFARANLPGQYLTF